MAAPANPRPTRAAVTATLRDVLHPRAVAVIGASRRPDAIGGAIFANLHANGFQGPVYPVNPQAEFVQSVRAYPSLAAIEGPVDLAILTVPRPRVLAAVEDCAAKGVKGLVVITAGFREVGAEGRALEDEALAVVRRAGMRMIGPNCLGILNTDPAVRLDATFAPTWPLAGRVAFSSQSGALGLAILDLAKGLGLGISTFLSIGNKADVSGNDLLEYWEGDPGTRLILLYLESFGNPRRFLELARRIGRDKPIVAVKSGRTSAGIRAASSHTGSLAGSRSCSTPRCFSPTSRCPRARASPSSRTRAGRASWPPTRARARGSCCPRSIRSRNARCASSWRPRPRRATRWT